MVRMRALVIASHPGPSLAITAMATVLAAEAAPHGFGPVLVAPAMLAGQLSVGWSNDACDAARRWIAVAGLCCSCGLAVAGAVAKGRTPFRAALAIAGADVAVFVFGADALTSAAHLSGALR